MVFFSATRFFSTEISQREEKPYPDDLSSGLEYVERLLRCGLRQYSVNKLDKWAIAAPRGKLRQSTTDWVETTNAGPPQF